VCSADFVVATLRDGDVNFSIQRIFRDKALVKDIIDKSACFFELCILPELLAKWYSREQVEPAQTAATSIVSDTCTYCYCKEDKGGEMVGCDDDDCESGQWFHLKLKNPLVPVSGIVQTVVSYHNLHERSKRNNNVIIM